MEMPFSHKVFVADFSVCDTRANARSPPSRAHHLVEFINLRIAVFYQLVSRHLVRKHIAHVGNTRTDVSAPLFDIPVFKSKSIVNPCAQSNFAVFLLLPLISFISNT
jgi:hypothetical protein